MPSPASNAQRAAIVKDASEQLARLPAYEDWVRQEPRSDADKALFIALRDDLIATIKDPARELLGD